MGRLLGFFLFVLFGVVVFGGIVVIMFLQVGLMGIMDNQPQNLFKRLEKRCQLMTWFVVFLPSSTPFLTGSFFHFSQGPRTVCLMSGTYPSEGNSNLVFMDDPLIFLALDGQGSVQIILGFFLLFYFALTNLNFSLLPDNEDIFLVYNGPDFQMSNVSLKGGNQILDVTLTTTNDVSFKLFLFPFIPNHLNNSKIHL